MDRTGFEPTTSCIMVEWRDCLKIAKQALFQAELPAQMILEHEVLRILPILSFVMRSFDVKAIPIKKRLEIVISLDN